MRSQGLERLNQIRKELECLAHDESAVSMEESQDKSPGTSKIRITYFKLEVAPKSDLSNLKFHSSGHAEQVLRGLVHSGFKVSIEEVKEILNVTPELLEELQKQDANIYYFDDRYLAKRAYSGENVCCVQPTARGRG